ncbi:MAG: hypothetical protein H7067_07150, partial [Burkholderiales bacterium]|nr:hypothetical protein [Opitutaceae bacterium]
MFALPLASLSRFACFSGLGVLAFAQTPTNPTPSASAAHPPASGGTLIREDFDAAERLGWPVTAQKRFEPGVMAGPFGTVDVPGGTEPSGGLRLVMAHGVQPAWTYGPGGYVGPSETAGKEALATRPWNARLGSGPLAVKNTETHLGKLTLAFSLSATRALPIRVRIESF